METADANKMRSRAVLFTNIVQCLQRKLLTFLDDNRLFDEHAFSAATGDAHAMTECMVVWRQ
jgi:hypothetical protein